MGFTQVTISDGQVSGVSDLSSAASSVVNFTVDESGANIPRPPLEPVTVSNLLAKPVTGLAYWAPWTIVTVNDPQDLTYDTTTLILNSRRIYAINDANPNFAVDISGRFQFPDTGLGISRPRFVSAQDHVYLVSGYVMVDNGSGIGRFTASILRWDGTSATVSAVTSIAATHLCALGQRLIANDLSDPQIIRWSAIGDGSWTSWSSGDIAEADARPDPVVALDENGAELFVWGSQTLQVYAVGSDPTFPFEPVCSIDLGIGAPYAYVRLDQAFAFLDSRKRIVISDGRSVRPISDAIQKDLRGLSDVADAHAFRLEYGQHSYLVWRFPTAGRTFVYDIKSEKWSEWQRYLAPFQRDFPAGAYLYRPSDEKHVVGLDSSDGGIGYFTDWPAQELDGPLVAERVTGWNDFGTANRKRSRCVRVVMKRGTAAEGATPGALEVRVQDDDGPWSDWEQVSVGGPSEYDQTVDLFMGGVFRRRRYGLRYSSTDNTAILQLLDDVTDLGVG